MGQTETFTEKAVRKVMDNARNLESVFARHYQDEGKRRVLKDAVETYAREIQVPLTTLVGGILAPPLKGPQTAFNAFMSTWNNGSGDLTRSYNAVSEFWRLLSAAQSQIDTILKSKPGGVGPPPSVPLTDKENQTVGMIAEQANALLQHFRECVRNRTPALAKEITEFVQKIDPLMKTLAPSHATELAPVNNLWRDFKESYKWGQGLNQQALEVLTTFVEKISILYRKWHSH